MLIELGFSPAADELYQSLIRVPEFELDELAAHARASIEELRSAREELILSGLILRSRERTNGVVLLDPEVTINRLLAAKAVEIARLQEQLATARASLKTLMSEYAQTRPNGVAIAGSVELFGLDAIQQAIEEWNRRARREVLTMDPTAQYSSEQIAVARHRDLDALERGVKLRRLYSVSSRSDPDTALYQFEAAQRGAQLRFIRDVPIRMTVFDREAGLIPMHAVDNGRSGVLMRGEAVTAILVRSFELLWATAEPLEAIEERQPHHHDVVDPTDLDRTLLKLMSMGVKDESIARHLGVSVRTVRRQIADLMTRLEAGSRFEAGMRAAFRGWVQ
ncbi:LuxR C-terminal-related transcriptional regulator [Jatrophihabitans sp.]|jgi:DNA-binding CsgD family transcriptional regulator/sugar-specific transcriptional regulator TrmB|uniref:LuxR C-terminal-related transcriptional regulator n=1 Tax=Jatrophihabitans sp. TaxID=1932789 RepID=UPI002F1C1070